MYSAFDYFSVMAKFFISIGSTPQSPTATMVDTMKEVLLSPTASGGEQDTGVADAAPRCVYLDDLSLCPCLIQSERGFSIHLCTIRSSDPNKTPAYAPVDLRDPDTDKPIFLQTENFPSMFEEPMLSYVFGIPSELLFIFIFVHLDL
jgi:hypothetical protein